jgi:predicted PurR-regulated permease PerM
MNISSRTVLKVLTLTAGFIGLLMLAWLARRELTWMGIAFFLAIALNPSVEWLTRWMPKRHRGLAIASVFIVLFSLLALLLVSFVPPLVEQSQSLARNLPGYTDQLIHGHGWISDQVRTYHLADRLKESQDQAVHYFTTAGTQLIGIVQSVFSSFIAGLTILGLTFFMLLEGKNWLEAFWLTVPAKRRPHARQLLDKMYKAVTGYVNGNLLTSLIAAITTSLVLAIVGVPYAIPLGIFVGIMDLLPLVGATIGALVVLTVALFTSITALVVMAIFFAVYQQIENHALQPIVYGKTVEISPLLVLVAVLIGAAVGGILGAIVAIPLFASLQILIRDYAGRHLIKA